MMGIQEGKDKKEMDKKGRRKGKGVTANVDSKGGDENGNKGKR